MPETVFGLPLHPLIVHATVVIVPLAAVLVLLAVLVPRFRDWAGPLPAITALVGVVLAPLSTSSGETLEHALGEKSPLLEEHAELGESLIWFLIPLFLLAAAYWWLKRTAGAGRSDAPRTVILAIGALAVIAALGTAVQVARIGHSGAESAWGDVVVSTGGDYDED